MLENFIGNNRMLQLKLLLKLQKWVQFLRYLNSIQKILYLFA